MTQLGVRHSLNEVRWWRFWRRSSVDGCTFSTHASGSGGQKRGPCFYFALSLYFLGCSARGGMGGGAGSSLLSATALLVCMQAGRVARCGNIFSFVLQPLGSHGLSGGGGERVSQLLYSQRWLFWHTCQRIGRASVRGIVSVTLFSIIFYGLGVGGRNGFRRHLISEPVFLVCMPRVRERQHVGRSVSRLWLFNFQ